MTAKLGPATHAIFRIGAGLLFLQHGLQKLFGLLGGVPMPGGHVPLASLFGVAGVLEFAGGLLIVAGLGTRPIAIVLLVEMLAAFAMSHMPKGGWPIENGGELALLYALVFAFLAANGAGPFSIDERVESRRPIPV